MWEPEMTSTALNSDKKWAFLLILRADWFVLIKVLKSQHAFRLKCKSLRGNCSHCHFDTVLHFHPAPMSVYCVTQPQQSHLRCLHLVTPPKYCIFQMYREKRLGWENVYRQIPPRYITVCINWELYINYISILKILRDISVTTILYYVQIDIPTKLMSFML